MKKIVNQTTLEFFLDDYDNPYVRQIHKGGSNLDGQGILKIQDLVDKHTPSVPTEKENRHGCFCPRCGQELPYEEQKSNWHYCPFCGQAISWNNDKKNDLQ